MSPPLGYKHLREYELEDIRREYNNDRIARGVEFGKCFCGCKRTTPLATRSRRGDDGCYSKVKGFPVRFCHNHEKRASSVDFVIEDRGFESACWIWQLKIDKYGYGRKWVDGKDVGAHRWHYEQEFGPIPPGYEPDHLCRVRSCVNPEHVEAVTHEVNSQRGASIKLNPSLVRAMRRAQKEQNLNYAQLSREFGVSWWCAKRACDGLTWRNV